MPIFLTKIMVTITPKVSISFLDSQSQSPVLHGSTVIHISPHVFALRSMRKPLHETIFQYFNIKNLFDVKLKIYITFLSDCR